MLLRRLLVVASLAAATFPLGRASRAAEPATGPDALATSRRLDAAIRAELAAGGVSPVGRANDEDFLRRVSFDVAGVAPRPNEVALFGIDPDPEKRRQAIERLLESPEFAQNWGRYWRDVVYSRETNQRARLGVKVFEEWMTARWQAGAGWDQIAREILTAVGDVQENGATGLIFAQGAEAEEVAAEASRILLGVQIQCANCHDHPTDKWKREEFHQLAAFFPRVQLRPSMDAMRRSFEVASLEARGPFNRGPDGLRDLIENAERFVRNHDRNGDGKVAKDEIRLPGLQRLFERLVENGDVDKDGQLSAAEIKALPVPNGRTGAGSAEHFMPDLENPGSRGTEMAPVFFLTGATPGTGLDDLARRTKLAEYVTAPTNPWFAKAFINRIWHELCGEGFYMPVDDIGPERIARHPAALDLLADGFIANRYDIRWLFRTILNSETYQQTLRPRNLAEGALPFASACPTRLRADQLYDAIVKVLGIEELGGRGPARPGPAARFPEATPRGQFHLVFGVDPSTPQDEITGSVPQALFFMNSPLLNSLIRGTGQTRLARILQDHADDEDALRELYLLVLTREPSDREIGICRKHIENTGRRQEAYEDLMWCLLNSSEFLTKR